MENKKKAFINKTIAILHNILNIVIQLRWIILMAFCFFLTYKIRNVYRYRFKYNNITKSVFNKAKYVGNAVFIRDKYFLTIADNLFTTCVRRNPQDKLYYFLVMDGSIYKVSPYFYDLETDLAVISVDDDPYYPKFSKKNFALFSTQKREAFIKKHVYISKSLNNTKDYFFKKKKIARIGNYGYEIRSFDNIRNNVGEVVLNDNLEMIGITVGNTTKGAGLMQKMNNKIEVVDLDKIKSFLRGNGFYFYENRQNIDLYRIRDYLKSLNGKVVCYIEPYRQGLSVIRSR